MTRDRETTDRLIDDVAKRMTSTEPPAALSAKVMARIASESRASGGDAARPGAWLMFSGRAWRLMPVAGLAIVAVAAGVVVIRHRGGVTPTVAAVTTPAPAIERPATIAVVTPDVTPARRALRRAAEPTIAELEWQARAVPALEQPNPLAVTALEATSVDIPDIQVAPVIVAPLGNSGGVR